jgi:hypothetical protein
LKERQKAELENPDMIEYVEGNRNPNFKIKKREADLYVHVLCVTLLQSPGEKRFNRQESVVPIPKTRFDQLVKEGGLQQYDEVEVVHDPRPHVKSYNLKPGNLESKDEPATVIDKNAISAIEKAKNTIDNEKKNLGKIKEKLDDKAKELDSKESNLDERERKIAEREKALGATTTTAAPTPASTPKAAGPTALTEPVTTPAETTPAPELSKASNTNQ